MAMISRRKIISRSQSELDYSHGIQDDEDVWFSKEKLFQDHITEILRKWNQIDDEIWGKIICMERNRRIAKAYSRVPVLTISGSDEGFDGYKIGLNGFDNPMRDSMTKTVKSHIGRGVRLKMDDMGNIIIKRMSNCDVFIRGWDRETNSLSKEIIELSGELEFEKSVKLFDMKKFQAGIARELVSSYPDRRKLENQCICAIAFVKDAPELLDLCSWIMLINIVALDLLKSRFPAILQQRQDELMMTGMNESPFKLYPQPKFISVFDHSNSSSDQSSSSKHRSSNLSDEDPYSLPLPTTTTTANAIISSSNERSSDQQVHQQHNISDKGLKSGGKLSSNSHHMMLSHHHHHPSSHHESDPMPPELPPRDFAKIKKSKSKNLPQAIKSLVKSSSKQPSTSSSSHANSKSSGATTVAHLSVEEKRRQEIEYEDPYYCGLQARVPNFGMNRQQQAINNRSKLLAIDRYGYTSGSHQQNRLDDKSIGMGLASGRDPLSQLHSSNGAAVASQLEIRKSQSNGYLNTLFNRSSSGFFSSSKKLDPQNKRNSASFNSNPYSDSSLESDGYGISSGSGYDIYAPLTSPLYGRLRAQLHMNSGSSIQHPSNPLHNNNLKTSNNNNVSSRTTGNGKSKGGSSSNNNSSSKNLSSNGISNSSGGNNYRAKERLEVMPFDHRSERYASAWD